MNIKFYGGVNEIGGNRIWVEDEQTRLLLDYGSSFNRNRLYYEEFLKPRYASTGIKDLLRLNLIHDLPEIYRNDLLALIGKAAHGAPPIAAIFLSHIHLDHSGLISILDERIPIICTKQTKAYAQALLTVGTRGLETEIPNFKRRPLLNVRDAPVEREFITLQSGQEVKVGDATLTLLGVDHSVLGAAGCILKTKSKTLVYTGDLRVHGKLGSQSAEFIQAAAGADPDGMLCEGTRIDEVQENTTEEEVKESAIATVKQAKGLVIGDFAFRDLTRLTTFYEIARETGRNLIISKRDAYVMDALRTESAIPFPMPSPADKHILVYLDRKGTGTYSERDYDMWERPYLNAPNAIEADQVREQGEDFLIHLTFFDISELVDINPPPGATYIHSASEPHHEEQVIDEERLNNWLDYFKASRFHYHASGHASGLDIRRMVETIKPKLLIPIHTEHPDIFNSFHRNVKAPTLEPFTPRTG